MLGETEAKIKTDTVIEANFDIFYYLHLLNLVINIGINIIMDISAKEFISKHLPKQDKNFDFLPILS